MSTAHIVYASDNKFAMVLGVSLLSLYEVSQDIDIVVYILDGGISIDNRAKLEAVAKGYGRKSPVWIPAKDITKEIGMKVSMDRGSLSQFARLFVSKSLPGDLERVIYLDCDTIIHESIRTLWEMELRGKTVGALKDAFSKYYRVNIDLEPNDIMFNSGVMIIDMHKWKATQVEEKLVAFIKKKNGHIQQADQGALNAVLSHETYCFEPRFNSVTIFHDFSYKEMLIYRQPPKGFYTKGEVQTAVECPAIIHFTTSFLSYRPWEEGCKHKYARLWLNYKAKSPWRDEPLWVDSRKKWKRYIAKIFQAIPRGLAIRIAGVLQVYGRPFVNRIRR